MPLACIVPVESCFTESVPDNPAEVNCPDQSALIWTALGQWGINAAAQESIR